MYKLHTKVFVFYIIPLTKMVAAIPQINPIQRLRVSFSLKMTSPVVIESIIGKRLSRGNTMIADPEESLRLMLCWKANKKPDAAGIPHTTIADALFSLCSPSLFWHRRVITEKTDENANAPISIAACSLLCAVLWCIFCIIPVAPLQTAEITQSKSHLRLAFFSLSV